MHFHRLVAPMREAVSGLMRREHGAVAEPLYPYYQDVYDHVLRVVESTDALRDLVATIVETNLSLRDYRQNQIMKKVTSWAAIIAVPTLVTGYYGMNVPYPGFARHWGVWFSTGPHARGRRSRCGRRSGDATGSDRRCPDRRRYRARPARAEGCHMWIAIGVIAVILLIIGVLLVPPRPTSGDGPLPLDVEAAGAAG